MRVVYIIYLLIFFFAAHVYTFETDSYSFLGRRAFANGDYHKALFCFHEASELYKVESVKSNMAKIDVALTLSMLDSETANNYLFSNILEDENSKLPVYLNKYFNTLFSVNAYNEFSSEIKYVLLLNPYSKNISILNNLYSVLKYTCVFLNDVDQIKFLDQIELERQKYANMIVENYINRGAYISGFNFIDLKTLVDHDSACTSKILSRYHLLYYKLLNEVYLDKYVKSVMTKPAIYRNYNLFLDGSVINVFFNRCVDTSFKCKMNYYIDLLPDELDWYA